MKNTLDRVRDAVERASAPSFDPQVFAETGFFILRQAIPPAVVKHWQDTWRDFYATQLSQGRDVNRANPVALAEELPEPLASMYKEPVLIDTAKQIFGEDIALYHHRFVIKDAHSAGKVFLHQDSCYHMGNLAKCSFFVPLSISSEENGGMSFHPGSHKLGYLGDAGEINPASFDMQWPKVTPTVEPGDFTVMNSLLWHESGPNKNGVHRILADMIMQPADDPTGIELLAGQWKTDIFYPPVKCSDHFVNSRILKIIKYETELGLREPVKK